MAPLSTGATPTTSQLLAQVTETLRMASDVKGWGQHRWWQGGDTSDVGGGNVETQPTWVASDMATQVTWVANNMEDDVGGQ